MASGFLSGRARRALHFHRLEDRSVYRPLPEGNPTNFFRVNQNILPAAEGGCR
jgi:hypothetical protein